MFRTTKFSRFVLLTRGFSVSITAFALLGSGSATQAANYTANTSGDWSTSGTWTPAAAVNEPGTNDNAFLNVAVTYDALATGVVNYLQINNGGSLTLGADLTTNTDINVYNGGLLDLVDRTHVVNSNVQFGGNGGGGALARTTGSLNVGNQLAAVEGSTLTLGAGDTMPYLYVQADAVNVSTVTTAATGNITTQATNYAGDLTLGANLVVTNQLNTGGSFLGRTGQLIMNGFSAAAQDINFGGNGAGAIVRNLPGETLTATNQLAVTEGSQLQMIAGDTTQYLYVQADAVNVSTVTTAATGNITAQVTNYSGDLTLGANLVVTNELNTGGSFLGRTGQLIMNGFSATAQNINFGGNGAGAIVRNLAGETLTATNQLAVTEGSQLQMIAGDTTQYLYVQADAVNVSTVTTAATGNITTQATNYAGDLTLGANLVVTNDVNTGGSGLGRTGQLIMNGFSVTAQNINFGGNGGGTSDGTGSMFANVLQVFEGSTGRARGGVIDNSIIVHNGGNLFQVLQAGGQVDGLTLDNSAANALNLNSNGVLNLQFDNATAGGALAGNPATFDWAFRWQGNHEANLQGLFSTQLTVTGAAGFNAADHIYYSLDDDYTYIGFLQAENNVVPEPSTLVLAALGLLGLGCVAWRRRKSIRLVPMVAAATLILTLTTQATAASYSAAASGNWTTPATWGQITNYPGDVPASGDDAQNFGGFAIDLDASISDLGTVYIGGNTGSLDLQGNNLGVTNFNLFGFGSGSLTRTGGGIITATNEIGVGEGSSLALVAGDTTASLSVGGGGTVVTTAATSNITTQVINFGGGTLILGAPLTVSGDVYTGGGTGVLDMNGFNINANNFNVFGFGAGSVVRAGAETVTATNQIGVSEGSTFVFVAGDSTPNLDIGGGGTTVTTAATSNITTQVINFGGGTLNLGAPLTVTGDVYIGGGTGLLNFNGFDVTAANINFFGFGSGSSDGTGRVFTNSVTVAEGSLGKVKGGTVASSITVNDDANTLQVLQASGQQNGLTLDGATLNLNSIGVLNLMFDNAVAGGALAGDPADFDWAFRWKGDNVATLQGLFGSSNLTVTGAAGFNPLLHIFWTGNGGGIEDDYTYVGFLASQEEPNGVPEPSAFVLAALGLTGLGLLAWRRRR